MYPSVSYTEMLWFHWFFLYFVAVVHMYVLCCAVCICVFCFVCCSLRIFQMPPEWRQFFRKWIFFFHSLHRDFSLCLLQFIDCHWMQNCVTASTLLLFEINECYFDDRRQKHKIINLYDHLIQFIFSYKNDENYENCWRTSNETVSINFRVISMRFIIVDSAESDKEISLPFFFSSFFL